MLAAVVFYTMEDQPRENSPYYILNKALRDNAKETIRLWADYIWLLLNALKHLPAATNTNVYRGMKVGVHTLGDDYSESQRFVWNGFSSTATTINVMESFMGTDGERTLFQLELTEQLGRDLRDFSLFPSENEILLPPNMQFEVVARFDAGNGLTMVQCKQVEADDELISLFNHANVRDLDAELEAAAAAAAEAAAREKADAEAKVRAERDAAHKSILLSEAEANAKIAAAKEEAEAAVMAAEAKAAAAVEEAESDKRKLRELEKRMHTMESETKTAKEAKHAPRKGGAGNAAGAPSLPESRKGATPSPAKPPRHRKRSVPKRDSGRLVLHENNAADHALDVGAASAASAASAATSSAAATAAAAAVLEVSTGGFVFHAEEDWDTDDSGEISC